MMFKKLITFCYLCVAVYSSKLMNEDDAIIIQLDDGKIRGRADTTIRLNKTYYAFQGIPYAKSPIGTLRFQAPIRNDPWAGILNTTEDKIQCVQTSTPVTGIEDCLYINVYTPTLQNSNLLPVIVSIYGGAYLEGNGSYVFGAPDFLLEEDVVFVSFNYRLGIFGFYSTGDLVAPGNAGLKDQVLALKWVQNNIVKFGGDPSNVTLFGQSAGATSISYLLQSKLPSGLFKGAIMDSGISLCRWALSRQARSFAFEVGAYFSYFNETNSTGLLERLQSVNYTELQIVSSSLAFALATTGNALDGLILTPVIEPAHDGALFTGISYDLLLNGLFWQVPILMGFNSNEAAMFKISDIVYLYVEYYLSNSSMIIPTDMNPSWPLHVGSKISNEYFGPVATLANDSAILGWLTDELFARPIVTAAKLMSKFVPVYFYIFSYEGTLGGHGNRTVPGVVHNEELSYIYRQFNNITPTVDDEKMRSMMCKLWTNFAKFGNPTPTQETLTQNVSWIPMTTDKMEYMDIDVNLTMSENPEAKNMSFWRYLYGIYGNPPHKTF